MITKTMEAVRPIGIGDRVYCAADPRHEGKVLMALDGVALIEWGRGGLKSLERISQLTRNDQ